MMAGAACCVRSHGVKTQSNDGLSMTPFRALRPQVSNDRLARLLCPPYDVITPAARAELLAADPDNAVAVVLPEPSDAGYAAAAATLDDRVRRGVWSMDSDDFVFVYEMQAGGHTTRGLLGAVELRDPADGVILPHENTMAGPVADRLEVMTRTGADLEPIYLVYDGGGDASQLVKDVDAHAAIAQTTTPDGVTHRLWAICDAASHAAIAADLSGRRALIADGHHRYATYRERQRRMRESHGAGPWDRGLALLVDSTDYGPQVHAIHRVVRRLSLDEALHRLPANTITETRDAPAKALTALRDTPGFAAALTDGQRTVLIRDSQRQFAATARAGVSAELAALDVTVLHRVLVEQWWQLADDVDTVGYAHSVDEAIEQAYAADGFAVLLRATPVTAVADIAAAGDRMPRKSTLFTPKPASGLVVRRLADQSH